MKKRGRPKKLGSTGTSDKSAPKPIPKSMLYVRKGDELAESISGKRMTISRIVRSLNKIPAGSPLSFEDNVLKDSLTAVFSKMQEGQKFTLNDLLEDQVKSPKAAPTLKSVRAIAVAPLDTKETQSASARSKLKFDTFMHNNTLCINGPEGKPINAKTYAPLSIERNDAGEIISYTWYGIGENGGTLVEYPPKKK